MPEKKPDEHPPDDPEQSKRFLEKARQLGADESGTAFDAAMGVISQKKREDRPSKTKTGQ